MISLFEKHDPKTLNYVRKSVQQGYYDINFFRLNQRFWKDCKSISIDYSILEKTKDIAVIKADFPWNDLGDWKSIWENSKKDNDGISKNVYYQSIDSKNNLIYSNDQNQIITTIGINDTIIVGMKDAILVADKDQTQHVKKLSKLLNQKK